MVRGFGLMLIKETIIIALVYYLRKITQDNELAVS